MNIPYGKVVIYLLTFLGYVYSGYGSGLLSNLREAVLAAESVFGDVLNNVIKIAKKVRNVHDIFDAAVEEECIFRCPGGVEPKPNRNYVSIPNGCGSLGLTIDSKLLPLNEMKKCCDSHDICYDTCGKDKEICDIDFKRCLYKYCESYEELTGGSTMVKTCKGAAKILFTGTLTLGCKFYLDAQSNACYCPPPYGWKKKEKYTAGGARTDEL